MANELGVVLVNLLQATTKVVPLEDETIPRLVLNAATLMAKLVGTGWEVLSLLRG